MISMTTIGIAMIVVTLGWFTGRMMHNFVDFVMEAIEKHNRENRDEWLGGSGSCYWYLNVACRSCLWSCHAIISGVQHFVQQLIQKHCKVCIVYKYLFLRFCAADACWYQSVIKDLAYCQRLSAFGGVCQFVPNTCIMRSSQGQIKVKKRQIKTWRIVYPW